MEYWILQHNPANLRIGYPHPSEVPQARDYWHISRYVNDVSAGDIGFIWLAGSNRGIYKVATVVSVPPHSPEAARQIDRLHEADKRFWVNPAERDRLWQLPSLLIEHQYPHDFSPPVTVAELRQQNLGGLLVIRMPRWGIYRLEPSAGAQLLRYNHGCTSQRNGPSACAHTDPAGYTAICVI
jgi:hypothetical protein